MEAVTRSRNHILASLRSSDFELIRTHLRLVEMPQRAILARAGEPLEQVYFPHDGIISLVMRLAEGETVEAAMIGRDSVFGASSALDGGIAMNEAIVQLPGTASVLDLGRLRRASERSASLRATLIRHEQALLAQALQTAACNASHTVEARLSRWLLRARDLSGGDKMPLTQEFLAEMLGVTRGSVSMVANSLQRAGLIRYRRGQIEITDLAGLRASSCECYATVKGYYDRLQFPD
jgi:CRP-like cAMP-binding protein